MKTDLFDIRIRELTGEQKLTINNYIQSYITSLNTFKYGIEYYLFDKDKLPKDALALLNNDFKTQVNTFLNLYRVLIDSYHIVEYEIICKKFNILKTITLSQLYTLISKREDIKEFIISSEYIQNILKDLITFNKYINSIYDKLRSEELLSEDIIRNFMTFTTGYINFTIKMKIESSIKNYQ